MGELNKEIVAANLADAQNQVGTTSAVANLLKKSRARDGQARLNIGNDISTGGMTDTNKEGNNRFLNADGEVVFNLIFQHDDKMHGGNV